MMKTNEHTKDREHIMALVEGGYAHFSECPACLSDLDAWTAKAPAFEHREVNYRCTSDTCRWWDRHAVLSDSTVVWTYNIDKCKRTDMEAAMGQYPGKPLFGSSTPTYTPKRPTRRSKPKPIPKVSGADVAVDIAVSNENLDDLKSQGDKDVEELKEALKEARRNTE